MTARAPCTSSPVACVVNIALDYYFMGTLHLGPAGAALGTTPSQPAQYRRLMQFIREEGYTAAGFSREITVIDYGFTTDTEKFVTEIMIPLQKV